ncbi:MAG TPA: hypothetical protein VFJ94_13940 [Intrasporangium sp.]|nr:hypothetical protein [Intrasporangium sp.]HET7399614.1 hypothetical protein [Intrasporangium sp.]
MNQLEMLARERMRQRLRHRDVTGMRRGARVIAQEIRAARRHEMR